MQRGIAQRALQERHRRRRSGSTREEKARASHCIVGRVQRFFSQLFWQGLTFAPAQSVVRTIEAPQESS